MSYDIPEIVVEAEYTAISATVNLRFTLHDEEQTKKEVAVKPESGYECEFTETQYSNYRVIHEYVILLVPDLMYEFEPIGAMKARLVRSLLERLPANVHHTAAQEIVQIVSEGWVRHRIALTLADLDDPAVTFSHDNGTSGVVEFHDYEATRSSQVALAVVR